MEEQTKSNRRVKKTSEHKEKEKGTDRSGEKEDKEEEQEETLFEDGVVFGNVMIRRYFVPRDEEDPHYVKAFSPSGKDDAEILKFFETYGFVVVRDVLSAQECQDTVANVFDMLEAGVSSWICLYISNLLVQSKQFDRNDVATWSAWPSGGMEKVPAIGVQKIPCLLTLYRVHSTACPRENQYLRSPL